MVELMVRNWNQLIPKSTSAPANTESFQKAMELLDEVAMIKKYKFYWKFEIMMELVNA